PNSAARLWWSATAGPVRMTRRTSGVPAWSANVATTANQSALAADSTGGITGGIALTGDTESANPPYVTVNFIIKAAYMAGRGALVGGHAKVRFEHGAGTVPADIVVEWDLDGDGDFDDPLEDVTGFMLSAETTIGRDFPSQLLGKSGPGRLTVDLVNQDGRFGYFNAGSPLNQPPFSVRTGGRIRVRTV